MAIGDALVAPTGVQNQMYGQPSRVPGYSQGLGQAPGQMALPPEPMPIGRPTAVVGGPAYFTPQGYNAPPQPTQAFMPTDVRPDPIGQQFMRQMQSPMGQQFQAQYEATQAPMREAEMAQRAEQQAAQDARFQEMMDRIAELEGQLATPTPSPVPEPEPYVPGQTPFPGIPDFIRDMDFSNLNLPDFSNFDYDDIMRQYNDRESSDRETDARNAAQIRADAIRQNRERVEEPRFTTMPVPGVPRGPVMSIEDLLEGRVTTMPVEEPRLTTMRENMPPPVRLIPPEPFKRGRVTRRGPTGSIEVYDDNLRPPEPDMSDKFIKRTTSEPTPAPMMPIFSMPELPDFSNIPAPENVSTSFMPGSGMGRIGQGVATDRESLIGKKIFGQTITPESFGSGPMKEGSFFSAVARPDLPASGFSFGGKRTPAPVMPEPNSFFPGVMPELPDFSNIPAPVLNLGNIGGTIGMPRMTTPVMPQIDFSNMDFSSLRNFNSR